MYLNVSPPRVRFRRGHPPFLCPIVFLPIINGIHQVASIAQRDLLIGVSTTATRGQTPQQLDQGKRTRLCVPSGEEKEREARVETGHYREWQLSLGQELEDRLEGCEQMKSRSK